MRPLPRLLQQHMDGEVIVHALTAPAGGGGVRVDDGALAPVPALQLQPIAGRSLLSRDSTFEGFPIRPEEAQRTVIQAFDEHPALVNLAMMEAA